MRAAILLGIASFVLVLPTAFAEEAMDKEQIEKWSKYYHNRAMGYELSTVDGGKTETLKLIPTPVLRWNNPLRTTTHGECYAWANDGRVRAFATIFSYPHAGGRRVSHEFNAFGDKGLSVAYDGSEFWKVGQGDAPELKPVPESPTVATTAALRVAQMRRIARAFAAESTENDETQPLRLLPAPIYRYEQGPDSKADGALFAFVMGTDPEILLLLESSDEGSTSEWRFTAARHTYTSLKMTYDGTVVWTSVKESRDEPYHARHGIDQQPAVLE